MAIEKASAEKNKLVDVINRVYAGFALPKGPLVFEQPVQDFVEELFVKVRYLINRCGVKNLINLNEQTKTELSNLFTFFQDEKNFISHKGFLNEASMTSVANSLKQIIYGFVDAQIGLKERTIKIQENEFQKILREEQEFAAANSKILQQYQLELKRQEIQNRI